MGNARGWSANFRLHHPSVSNQIQLTFIFPSEFEFVFKPASKPQRLSTLCGMPNGLQGHNVETSQGFQYTGHELESESSTAALIYLDCNIFVTSGYLLRFSSRIEKLFSFTILQMRLYSFHMLKQLETPAAKLPSPEILDKGRESFIRR
ncbi:hypothetical protein DAPPUDRAFT_101598 [Daphnia pulex]|uniref:Uncharacterized protein n=1 Tax=Daphnia pulex TaxID=6669 RepID=E9GDW8_DAPPU|nr:hypothetical protein DAPPUDRAFT_101598 [Daphnia pulex]|eukprot:EFX82410.1 hypothetical protein DAPPUDRAFT_101598 [Daphnia pulex]